MLSIKVFTILCMSCQAQNLLLQQKNVIKLQAAVRGHIVRKHAVGTLRCVQAIVKMQTLVRARRARLLLDEPYEIAKLTEGNGNHDHKQAFSVIAFDLVRIFFILLRPTLECPHNSCGCF